MKFGRNVLNMHWLMGVGFPVWRHAFKVSAWRRVMQKSAAIWWDYMQHLPNAYGVVFVYRLPKVPHIKSNKRDTVTSVADADGGKRTTK